MIRVLIKLDAFSGSDSVTESRRQRELLVLGVSDESQVLSAIDGITGYAVPALGEAHPSFPGLRLTARDPQRITADQWSVRLDYAGTSTSGGGTGGQVEDGSVRWKWELGQETETRDYDVYDRPIVDRAGVPLAGGFPYKFNSLFLHVWRSESTFDVPTAYTLVRRVNKVRTFLLNRWFADPGQMMLWSITPEGDQRFAGSSVTPVTIHYTFEFRPGQRPFQPAWRNEGFTAWCSSGTPATNVLGRICNQRGEPIETPAVLGMDGKPTDTRLRVIDPATGTIVQPIANPNLAFLPVIDPHGSPPTAAFPSAPGTAANTTYQYALWQAPAEVGRLLSQDFYGETDFRGLIPGVV